MVHLEEVEDEDLPQTGNKELEDDDEYTDTESEVSDEDDDDFLPSETLGERLYALRDMVAPGTRRRIASNVQAASSWTWSGLRFGGRASFVLATAFLFYGIPFMLATVEDAQLAEQEQEMKLREQGTEMLTGGASTGGQEAGQPAL